MLLQTDLNELVWRPRAERKFERRCNSRLNLALPLVLVRAEGRGHIETKTENVSCNSFYCISDRPLSLDEMVECELLIPGDEVSSVPEPGLRLSCRARVVRVVARESYSGFGIACKLEDYTITRSSLC